MDVTSSLFFVFFMKLNGSEFDVDLAPIARWCVVKLGTLSLLFSLLPLLFPFLFSLIFLFLSSFSFSFSLAPSLTLALALVLSLSPLSSFLPSTHSSLLFPSRQQTLYKALINKHGVQL